jgi:phosphoserine phosphatase RsbU/P
MAEPAVHPGLGDDEALEDFYGALLDDDAQALYERAPCGYLSTTPDGSIVKVNQTFLTLTGYQRRDLVGRLRFTDLLNVGGRIYHETHYAPMLQMQGRAREIALDIVRADGSRLPALVNAVLERSADGTPATDRRRYEQELVAARQRAEASEAHARALVHTLQQSLIPPAPPDIDGLDLAAAYRPAGTGEEIGGDFYDVFPAGPHDWVIAIGDVQGKGVEAAVIANLVRHAIRDASAQGLEPARVMSAANDALLAHETDRFCTAVLLWLHRHGNQWTARVSAAGHALPLLVQAPAGPTPLGRPGNLLGIFPDAAFHHSDIDLRTGDSIVLYTDGVTEARREKEWYGDHRLYAAISRAEPSAAPIVESIVTDVLAFQADSPRDDIALVAVTLT